MKTISLSGVVLFVALAISCKRGDEKSEEAVSAPKSLSSDAAVEKNAAKHKFIRTADIKFKVKNVAKSTYAVENAVANCGGTVTNTNLKSEVNETKRTKISQDSIVETTRFTVQNDMTLRVPNNQLSNLLNTISKEVGYLDYRVINAEEVSLKLLSNQLAQDRQQHYTQRLENSVDATGKKLNQVVDAENDLLTKKENADNAKIQNLAIDDAISYSAVTLALYQDEGMRREVLANPESMSYHSGFGTQIVDSLKTGWYMLEAIISFVLQFWSLLLLGIVGYLGYRKFAKGKIAF